MIIERLEIESKFSDFKEFFTTSQEIIYRKVLNLFSNLYNDNVETKLIVVAHVDKFNFETEFKINRDNIHFLIKALNPFFEKSEEYDTCQEIQKLYSKLS